MKIGLFFQTEIGGTQGNATSSKPNFSGEAMSWFELLLFALLNHLQLGNEGEGQKEIPFVCKNSSSELEKEILQEEKEILQEDLPEILLNTSPKSLSEILPETLPEIKKTEETKIIKKIEIPKEETDIYREAIE